MKFKKFSLAFMLSSFLVLSFVGKMSFAKGSDDGYEYSRNTFANYAEPAFASDDEEEEEIGEVNKVIIHYVNDDNDCARRAFYVWVPGVDGEEYSNEHNNQPDSAVTYDSDSMMTITMDLKTDARFTPYFGTSSMMYIIKYKMISPSNLNWGGQSEDVELKYMDFPPVDGVVEVWCTPAAGGGIAQFATEAETKVDGVKLAEFVDFKTINCTLTASANNVEWTLYAFDETYFKVKPKNRPAIKKNYIVRTGESNLSVFNISLKYDAHINVVYAIESKDTASTTGLIKTVFVSYEKLYGTARFEEIYNYKGSDLGFTYTPDHTTFKVWSPVAANISLLVYESDTSAAYSGDDKYKGWHMVYQPNGVWELTLKGDLKGKYYNYQVDTWNGSSVTMDPYATGAGACGVRGMIYDKKDTNPDGWSSLPTKWDGVSGLDIKTPQELSIYEVHVQDFTGDSSWVSNKGNKNGTYNAFVEEGTTYTDEASGITVSTGFDHLRELGVNAVQLMPVFDSDNDEVKNIKYNWGYNPLNYNCVEGSYSSNPHDGVVRIKEYKNLVYQLASVGTRVIMDVVYNHVSSPSASCFNKLMPRYYFRYAKAGDYEVEQGWTSVGELYDGSGCHNEFKSEATMARKFIVDSVCMWAREYKIKGFRFDLMGLIDVETIRACKKALYQIDPDIYIYGEGWKADGWDHPFHGGWDAENNLQSQPTFCCRGLGNQIYSELWNGKNEDGTDHDEFSCYAGGFNDLGRNAIKGNNDPGWGFVQQGTSDASDENRGAVENMIWGAHSNQLKGSVSGDVIGTNPKQTINYASCHDNWTLRDQLYYTLGNPGNNQPGNIYNVMYASLTVHGLIFASNAAAFMLGGEELLRTKDLSVVSEEQFEDIPVDSYKILYEGTANQRIISHNSYNSPLIVNSFKWGNKVKVECDGVTVDTHAENLTGKFAEFIALHKKMPKYDLAQVNQYRNVTSKGNEVGTLSWKGFDKQNANSNAICGFQFDEYFFYISGRIWGYVECGTIPVVASQVLHCGDTYSYDAEKQIMKLGNSEMGDPSYGVGHSLVIYNAKGAR